jgi:multiple sugar transport system substrate-binding protein
MPTRRALLQTGSALAFAGPHRFALRELKHELRLMQWAHPTPGYDAWLARAAARWGERNDARVRIDHVNSSELAARARGEATTERGHDLVQLLAPPTAFQHDVVPLNDVAAEVTRQVGAPTAVARASGYNPRTGRWFAFVDHFVPLAAVHRTDLWPVPPRSWEAILAAAPALRRQGKPVAIGLSPELDSNTANTSMLLAHGGRFDRLRSPQAVAYLRAIAELYRRGMPREVTDWTPLSNNQLLFSGGASLIANPASAIAAAHRVGLPLELRASPLPGRSIPHTIGCWVLWRFSPNRELAERWLVDQQLAIAAHARASGGLNVPAWGNPNAGGVVGAGHPGPTNAAVQELLDAFVLPAAARRVALGKVTAEEAAADAEAQAREVFRKWREAKLI